LYPEGTTDEAFVTSIYTNLFNRAPDADGLAYWVAKLTATETVPAEMTRDVMIEAMKNGALGTDATIIANKASVGLAYAAAGLEGTTFSLDSVTADAATVSAALSDISDLSNPGSSFALSSGIQSGTAGVDTISATSATYAATTILDGKAGTDTLTVTATNDIAATPTVINVETVNYNLNAFSTTTGTTFVVATDNVSTGNINLDVTQVGSSVVSATVTGLATGTVVTASNDFTTAVTVSGKTDNEALTVTAKAAAITANSTGTLTAATITSTSATTATLTTDSDAAATLTTTAADMVISAVSATTVVATSAGSITAQTGTAGADLTAATSITLTAVDEVIIDTAAATAATISAGGASSTITDNGAKLATLNLSGNGSAATFDIQAATKVATVNISGTQNVTVVADADTITSLTGSKITVVDSSSATTTLSLVAASAAADLSAAAVDKIALTGINSGVLTVASGSTAVVGIDQTTLKFDGVDSTAANNTMTISLTDGATAGAVDIATSLTLTDFGSVTIDASTDTVASSITGITASADNTDVTINAGSLGITVAGTNTVGTGDLTINSTGAIALGASVITAANLTTVGSGAVTWTALDASKTAAVTTGDGADALTISSTNGNLVLNTGAGNDTIIISSATAAKTIAINAGDGTLDTLNITAGADLSLGTSVTLSGVERLDFDGAATIDNSVLTGASYIVADVTTGGTVAVTVDLGTDLTSNLSSLVIDTATVTAGDSFIINASTSTAGVTLTGSSITDTITGSIYADTITVGNGADTITGGASADMINLTDSDDAVDNVVFAAITDGSAAGAVGATFSGFDVITGYVTTEDTIDLSALASTAVVELYKNATDATLSINDLTTANYTSVDQVVNYMNDIGVAQDAAEYTAVVVKFSSTSSAIYLVDAGTSAGIVASEIHLIGTVDSAMATGDLIL